MVCAAFTGLFLSVGVLVVYSFGVLISSMSSEFGWRIIERSTLFTAFSLASTAGGLVWGLVADRFGGRAIVLIASLSLAQAAGYQSVLNLSLIGGRLLIGLLIDRVFAPHVMMGVLLITTAGFLILRLANGSLGYCLAAATIGLAIGAEVDFLGFMVIHYFPSTGFTLNFAVTFSSYALSASVAPLFFGWLAKTSGGYEIDLPIFAVVTLALALLMLCLPDYTTCQSLNAAQPELSD